VVVVDSSAVVAIFRREPDWPSLWDVIEEASSTVISAASVLETMIVLDGRAGGRSSEAELRDFLWESDLEIRPVTASQVWIAGAAYRQFGKGYHPARLNYGDCFSYALAKELAAPLLYKGDDFARTDIPSAL
jgi:ribonuclease VapC